MGFSIPLSLFYRLKPYPPCIAWGSEVTPVGMTAFSQFSGKRKPSGA
ncbi:hypothetical protein JOD24_000078 [Kroppenstedtia sanguinis]